MSQQGNCGEPEDIFLGPYIITVLQGKSPDLPGDIVAVLQKVNVDHVKIVRVEMP